MPRDRDDESSILTDRVEIRPARASELPAAIQLLIAQLREHGNGLDDEAIAHAATGLLERPERGGFLVAVADGTVIGLAAFSTVWSLERGGLAMWLDELYVTPDRRGVGVGGALLDAALATARALGAHAVELEVDADHARAANLYRRAGFAALPRRRWVRALD